MKMTDISPEILERVEAAIDTIKTGENGYVSIPISTIKHHVMSELTQPETKFQEGQVLIHVARDGDYDFIQYGQQSKSFSWIGWQPLNQAEVGPNWVPREAVQDLRESMERISRGVASDLRLGWKRTLDEDAKIALAAFDSAIGESDE